MKRVATYVFIDLETTSLPEYEYNKTRITELSMVVVKRRHILDTRPGAAPRVQDKLSMCFNPRRMVDPGSTETSGLCNDLLEHQTDFNMNVFNTIDYFLKCLEKPVCLIAQNGHAFDFPILKNHFMKLNVSLPEDILCADSLHAFCDILEAKNVVPLSVLDVVVEGNTNSTGTIKSSESAKHKTNEVVKELLNEQDCSISNTHANSMGTGKLSDSKKDKTNEELVAPFDEFDCSISNTPLREPIMSQPLQDNDSKDLKCQHSIQELNEKTPVKKQQLLKPFSKIGKVKRKLFWGANPKPVHSYKLKDVYERVLGRPGIEAHRAENDCTMAMEISISIAQQFVDWVDTNCCEFSEVVPMRVGYSMKL